jgi:hypothetical protein
MGLLDNLKKVQAAEAAGKPQPTTGTKPVTLPTEKPTTVKPVSTTPTKNPTVNKFEDTYGDAIRSDKALTKHWNYETGSEGTRFLIKAINGKYDQAINNPDVDEDVRANLKSIKENALKAANLAKKGFSSQADIDAYYKAYNTARSGYINAQNKIDKNANSNYKFDDQMRFVTADDADKSNVNVQFMGSPNNDKNQNTELDKDGEDMKRVEKGSSWNKQQAYASGFRNTLESKTKPYVREWLDSGLNKLNDTSNKTNRANMYHMSVDILQHAYKYGTKEKGEAGKKDAKLVLEKLWKAKGLDEKLAIIKANKDSIKGIHNQMGYYGNAVIFNKYSDTKKFDISRNLDYYSDSDNGTPSDKISKIDGILNYNKKYANYRERLDATHVVAFKQLQLDSSFKNKVGKSNYALENLVDKNGKIVPFKKWFAGLESQKYTQRSEAWSEMTEDGKMLYHDATSQVRSKADDLYGANLGFTGDKIKRLREIYNQTVHHFKLKHDDVTKEVAGELSGMVLEAGGENLARNIGYKHVDLSITDDYRLKNQGNVKQRNVANILGMLKNEDGSWNTSSVAIFDGKEYKTADAEEFKNRAGSTGTYAENYLKPGKNMSDYSMTYERNTAIPGASAYVFRNKKDNNIAFAIVANKSAKKNANGGSGEYFHKNTYESSDDYLFNNDGVKELPVSNKLKDAGYINAKIVVVDGIKQLRLEPVNTKDPIVKLNLGVDETLSIVDAQKQANNLIEYYLKNQ